MTRERNADLKGLRILIVEDEFMISLALEELLNRIGCRVAGVAGTFGDGRRLVDGTDFDVAILDINLDGVPVYPLAADLSARGVPFAFASGYSDLVKPACYETVPQLLKPFGLKELETVLHQLRSALAA